MNRESEVFATRTTVFGSDDESTEVCVVSCPSAILLPSSHFHLTCLSRACIYSSHPASDPASVAALDCSAASSNVRSAETFERYLRVFGLTASQFRIQTCEEEFSRNFTTGADALSGTKFSAFARVFEVRDRAGLDIEANLGADRRDKPNASMRTDSESRYRVLIRLGCAMLAQIHQRLG
uniref:Uncharacterized protein n=1 Tax=Mycena chlorophos TaxID=658473 RepID=A0ABQ0LBC0_MYCCL|nr:predicted protein [Mycena chlorophos]